VSFLLNYSIYIYRIVETKPTVTVNPLAVIFAADKAQKKTHC